MAQLGQTFDANNVPPQAPRETIPPGKYVVQIINSEMRPTKDGMGQYLWLELEVIDGEYTGRHLFDRLNLVNNNPQAVEIAQRALSAICHATGQMQVKDSEQLHFKAVLATVKVRPARDQYEASNEIGGYGPANLPASVAAPAPIRAAAPVAAKAASPAAPPWRRAG